MKALRYTGAAMVEFKSRDDGKSAYLMEINGRLWSSLPLTVAAGLDIPLYGYQMLRKGRRSFPRTYRIGLASRNWLGERFWLSAKLSAWRSRDPASSPYRLPESWASWRTS